MSLYIHDFSGMVDIPIGPDGAFEDAHTDSYWIDGNRYPYFIKADGKLAGFVLIITGMGSRKVNYISEFFVLRGYRRKGVGAAAAASAFKAFPGPWEVTEIPENPEARTFWRRVIGEFTGGQYEESTGEDGDRSIWIQSFRSGR